MYIAHNTEVPKSLEHVKTNIKYGVQTLSETKSVVTKCERKQMFLQIHRRFELTNSLRIFNQHNEKIGVHRM